MGPGAVHHAADTAAGGCYPLDRLDIMLQALGLPASPYPAVLRAAAGQLGIGLHVVPPAPLRAIPEALWPVAGLLGRVAAVVPGFHWGPAQGRPACPIYGAAIGAAAGSGIDLDDPALALRRAVSEAVERWVWRSVPAAHADPVIGTAEAFGPEALDLERLAGWAPALRRRRARRPLAWIVGEDLVRGAPRRLPAQLVSLARLPGAPREPELRPWVTTGVAAHPDPRQARLRALLEAVERDAFMITWLARRPGRPLRPGRLAPLLQRLRAQGLEVELARLATDAPAAVVAAAVRRRRGAPALTVAVRASATLGEAALGALLEAYKGWWGLRASWSGAAPASPAGGPRARARWWAAPGRWRWLQWLFSGLPAVLPDAEGEPDPAETLARLTAWLAERGYEGAAVELTPPRLRLALGLSVVAVAVPELHPMHADERRPARWSLRLEEALGAAGRSRPANMLPLPLS
jgi:ribosomal protein S12 methylthiotransferase accessory factor